MTGELEDVENGNSADAYTDLSKPHRFEHGDKIAYVFGKVLNVGIIRASGRDGVTLETIDHRNGGTCEVPVPHANLVEVVERVQDRPPAQTGSMGDYTGSTPTGTDESSADGEAAHAQRDGEDGADKPKRRPSEAAVRKAIEFAAAVPSNGEFLDRAFNSPSDSLLMRNLSPVQYQAAAVRCLARVYGKTIEEVIKARQYPTGD